MNKAFHTRIYIMLLMKIAIILKITVYGYQQSISDPYLFIKSNTDSFIALLIYVDNLILAGNDFEEITLIKLSL